FFASTAGFIPSAGAGAGQSYGNDYLTAQVTDPNGPNTDSATWQQALPDTSPTTQSGATWSVFVWIPAGTGEDFAHFAHYQITNGEQRHRGAAGRQRAVAVRQYPSGGVLRHVRRARLGARRAGAGRDGSAGDKYDRLLGLSVYYRPVDHRSRE